MKSEGGTQLSILTLTPTRSRRGRGFSGWGGGRLAYLVCSHSVTYSLSLLIYY